MATKAYTGKITFESPINKESSFGSVPLSDNSKSEIEVTIRENGTGYFEWSVPDLDEYEEGGLWFEGNAITDYDGVMCLPKQLIDHLKEQGYDMSYVED